MAIKCPKCHSENPDDTFYCGKCAAPLAQSHEAVVSKTLTIQHPPKFISKGRIFAGKYRMIEPIGKGGMGVVYKAEDIKLERTVALKFLPAELTDDPEARERFVREAKAAAALSHPHICTIYEVGEDENQYFIAMECIEGKSLKDKIREGRLEQAEAVNIAIQVAEGLEEAHKRGIVHRDIKPGNIMVTEKGTAKVMDFGLAKVFGASLITKEAKTMGTVAYMSPEQAQSQSVDHQTDIWSLGVVLYEMLTGQLPFKGEYEQSVMYSIVNKEPETLTKVLPIIAKSLENVVHTALAKNPDNRYQSMEDLLGDLQAIAEGFKPLRAKARPQRKKILGVRRAHFYSGLGILFAAAAIALLLVFSGRSHVIDSIAVLPLSNLSGDSEQEYFVDSITEALITELAQISSLRVISRTSVMMFKGAKKTISEIAKELNVSALVEGSVSRSGDQLKITVQLIQANPEKHLGAKSYTHAVRDVLNLPEEAARSIIDEIKPKLTEKEATRLRDARTVNPEAFELVLKGRYLLDQFTEQSLWQSVDYFHDAIEKDPSYAKAYHGLGEAYMSLVTYGSVAPLEGQPKGREYLNKAIKLDASLAEAHVGLGWDMMFYLRDWEGAEREFRRALEINPNARDAHEFYAMFLADFKKDWKGAFFHMNRAIGIDPLNLMLRSNLAFLYFMSGQKQEALAGIQEVLKMAPNFGTAYVVLGHIYLEEKAYDEAVIAFEKAQGLIGETPVLKGIVGSAMALGGREEEARSILGELKELSKARYVPSYSIALIYAGLGENDQAFEYLEKAYEENARGLAEILVFPGQIEPIRSDPRFPALLKKIGLEK